MAKQEKAEELVLPELRLPELDRAIREAFKPFDELPPMPKYIEKLPPLF